MDRVIAFRFLNFPILLLPWPSCILTRWPQFEFWLTFTFLLLAWLFNCSLHAGLFDDPSSPGFSSRRVTLSTGRLIPEQLA